MVLCGKWLCKMHYFIFLFDAGINSEPFYQTFSSTDLSFDILLALISLKMTYIYKKISKLDIMTLYYFQSSLKVFFYYTHEHHSLVLKKIGRLCLSFSKKEEPMWPESNTVLYIQASHVPVHSEEFCTVIYNPLTHPPPHNTWN